MTATTQQLVPLANILQTTPDNCEGWEQAIVLGLIQVLTDDVFSLSWPGMSDCISITFAFLGRSWSIHGTSQSVI